MVAGAGIDRIGLNADEVGGWSYALRPRESERRPQTETRALVLESCDERRSKTAPALRRPVDLDGVLVDTRQYHLRAFQRLLGELGHELTEEQFRGVFGLRNEDLLRRLVPGLPADEIPELSKRKEGYYLESLPERIPLLPGAERLVLELDRQGAAQAVASSTPRENLDVILPRLGLPLEIYVGAEDVEEGKPQPDVFLSAAARLGMPPRLCVVVEDARAGVEAARRAAMASLAVATTWPAEQLSGADMVVDSLEEVTAQDLARLALRTPAPGNRETE